MSMHTLEFVRNKFGLDINGRPPIEIPNYGRDQLGALFHELAFRTGVEIGVANGVYSETLMKANPQLKMWGVDPYEPHQGYRDYVHESTFNQMLSDAHERLDKFPNYTFIRKYSMDALADFEDGTLDFVYIDGDHCFESCVADIAGWIKKIRPGGIIAGHDYVRHKGNARIQVMQAVQGYTDAWQIKPWFLLGTEAKVPGQIRDAARSWMWVV